LIQAHHGAVAAVAFSDDGKYLASFSPNDLKVNLWHVSNYHVGLCFDFFSFTLNLLTKSLLLALFTDIS